jgi:hypothetical protein
MNSINIIPQKRPIQWSRVLFHISKCSGKIKRKFNPDILFNKLEQEDVNIIMALIEKESGKFTLLRFFYKISIIVIIFSILVFISSLIFFFVIKNSMFGMIFLTLSVLLVILYLFIINTCINKRKKSYLKRLYPITDEINRKLFNMRNLYLMIDREIEYVCIYIVPAFIEATVLLKNMLYDDSHSSEEKNKPSENNYINGTNNKSIPNDFSSNKTKDVLKINVDAKGLGLL